MSGHRPRSAEDIQERHPAPRAQRHLERHVHSSIPDMNLQPQAKLGLPARVHACLFDLDGVLTQTAKLHAAAWKQAFDHPCARAHSSGEPFVPFDLVQDYDRYVDGKPRADGTRSFLAARGIHLPEGDERDPPSAETLHGIGTRKNEILLALLHEPRPPPPIRARCATCAPRGRAACAPRWSRRAPTAARCCSPPAWPGCSTRASTAWSPPRSSCAASPPPTPISRRRARSASTWRRRWSSRTRWPASRPAERGTSATSSASIASARPQGCAAHGADVVVHRSRRAAWRRT